MLSDLVGSEGEIFQPLAAFLSETSDDPEIQRECVETLNIILSRGNEPLIKNLYPFLEDRSRNVYVTCMLGVAPNAFEQIYETYKKCNTNADDIIPLLHKFKLKEEEAVVHTALKRNIRKGGIFGRFDASSRDNRFPDLAAAVE
ncbi:hypothetical protein HK101_003499, partial [Irineochytrium annulatum]